MHIRYVPHERPPFSALIAALEHIIFTNDKTKSALEHHHFPFFAAPENIIFKISLPSSCSLQLVAGLLQPARTQSVRAAPRGYSQPECQPDTSCKVSSGDPYFHARALEPRIFTLDSLQSPHFSFFRSTYLPKFGVSAPLSPPPPPRRLGPAAVGPRL